MKMRHLLLFFFSFLCFQSFAADGDITTIAAHDQVDMTWHGNYDNLTSFPDGSTSYRKVLMHYTMGCSSSQCSDWDYTTRIYAMFNTGVQDSTVSVLDTLSTDPLVVDTTWNVFDVMEPFTLGEVITPYGGYMAGGTNGFSNAWEHTHTFDVTDLQEYLKDDVVIRAFYDGWSDGFSVTVDFEFVEGPPARNVLNSWNYYTGGLGYTSFTEVENDRLPEKTYNFPAGTSSVKFRVNKSGHGADDNGNCAEFCPKYYRVFANGTNVAGNVYVWRDDCGSSHTWPQGGTWLYSREGWCPGERSELREFELGQYMTFPGENAVNLDLESISWSGGQPYYYIDAQVVAYGDYNAQYDAEITEILAPSDKDDYSRMNPMCDDPVIRVTNMGSETITTLDFRYGIYGGYLCDFQANVNIAPSTTADVTLPNNSWFNVDEANPQFRAEILQVNGNADEYPLDNAMTTSVILPDVHSNGLVLDYRINNRPQESSYTIEDSEGNVVMSKNSSDFSSNTSYQDDLSSLANGCYTLRFRDTGPIQLGSGDGLNHWVSTQYLGATTGFVRLRDGAGTLVETFNADFGNELHYAFILGNDYGAASGGCLLSSAEDILDENVAKVYPNPSRGNFRVETQINGFSQADYQVFDMSGRLILQGQTNDPSFDLNMENQAEGVYFLNIRTDAGIVNKQLVIAR